MTTKGKGKGKSKGKGKGKGKGKSKNRFSRVAEDDNKKLLPLCGR